MSSGGSGMGEITGRQVLLGCIAFFGVVFAANGYFIFSALSTNTGVVANEPYRKGLKYNERIKAFEAQQELGWSDKLVLSPAGDRLTMEVRDRSGSAVGGLVVKATIGRPATDREDVAVELSETATGHYEGVLPQRAPGAYVASVEVSGPEQGVSSVLYRAKERLWLKP